jgi:hypothetical protein
MSSLSSLDSSPPRRIGMTDYQLVELSGGGRLAAKPPTYLLPLTIKIKHRHSERSEESQMFSRSVVIKDN